MSILNKIPSLNGNELFSLFQNALDLIRREKQVHAAEEVLEAIQYEWDVRLKKFNDGKYKATTPEEGMLKALGYCVGQNGIKTNKRRQILDFIIQGTLPPISSPAYVAEWDTPLSKGRYRKLHRVIKVLSSSGETIGNMDKAVMEWLDDLEYLESKWANSWS